MYVAFYKNVHKKGCDQRILQILLLDLVHSNTFYAFDRVVAIVLNYKVLQLQLPVEQGA